jgi:glycosyltransferase involved in cell wall biosynthesis
VGDIPEILDESCGALIPPDAPGALAEAVARLAGSGELRARLGRAAHERIRERGLTLDESLRRYERLYEEL